MTSRSYFGKMNSTLGSVVPLAMFLKYRQEHVLKQEHWKVKRAVSLIIATIAMEATQHCLKYAVEQREQWRASSVTDRDFLVVFTQLCPNCSLCPDNVIIIQLLIIVIMVFFFCYIPFQVQMCSYRVIFKALLLFVIIFTVPYSIDTNGPISPPCN